MSRIAIIGLGLIGGSIGLALKRAQIDGLEIVGHDVEWGTVGRARKLGAIDAEARDVASAVDGAAVVVIATPILQARKALEEIAPAVGDGAVVTDTASTKCQVLRWAEEILPREVAFVGGHPIAGKEQSGIDAADATLFEGQPWALIPSVHASERAIKTIENLVALVGARPVVIDPEEHDSYLAAVSHLPMLLSTALFRLASKGDSWPELAVLAGPAFRDITRLASGDPNLSHDICLTNRENLLHWLDRYRAELRELRDLIAGSETDEELYELFVRAQADRDTFVREPPSRAGPERETDIPSVGERMMGLLVGEYVVRRTKELEELMGQRADDAERGRGRKQG